MGFTFTEAPITVSPMSLLPGQAITDEDLLAVQRAIATVNSFSSPLGGSCHVVEGGTNGLGGPGHPGSYDMRPGASSYFLAVPLVTHKDVDTWLLAFQGIRSGVESPSVTALLEEGTRTSPTSVTWSILDTGAANLVSSGVTYGIALDASSADQDKIHRVRFTFSSQAPYASRLQWFGAYANAMIGVNIPDPP